LCSLFTYKYLLLHQFKEPFALPATSTLSIFQHGAIHLEQLSLPPTINLKTLSTISIQEITVLLEMSLAIREGFPPAQLARYDA